MGVSNSKDEQLKGIKKRKNILQKLEQQWAPSDYWGTFIDKDSGFIVKGKTGTSACSGDSGGPFLCKM